MLKFYSYYKQATVGACNIPRPGFWDAVGKVKWSVHVFHGENMFAESPWTMRLAKRSRWLHFAPASRAYSSDYCADNTCRLFTLQKMLHPNRFDLSIAGPDTNKSQFVFRLICKFAIWPLTLKVGQFLSQILLELYSGEVLVSDGWWSSCQPLTRSEHTDLK